MPSQYVGSGTLSGVFVFRPSVSIVLLLCWATIPMSCLSTVHTPNPTEVLDIRNVTIQLYHPTRWPFLMHTDGTHNASPQTHKTVSSHNQTWASIDACNILFIFANHFRQAGAQHCLSVLSMPLQFRQTHYGCRCTVLSDC